ncbi:phage integrase [[Leptolyngbya] sp. PCC 7376]|uniref:phage integrase n=1 Tax=[Leptolyngbya] sp. PCC 7376 TaxID=111781 RepID=UPI00029EFD1C|nr:phage integrase [[Leptolyngbya] sp. PCC 7376]AFY39935.1 phage integrase [[Leptolyngbya] sp. PCC 7376]
MDLGQVNSHLKSLQLGVAVEKQGQRLCLRATLPPRPDSKQKFPFQQRISLGINANQIGLRRAQEEAIKLGELISSGKFDWSLYPRITCYTCAAWCERFKKDYFQSRPDRPSTHTTYRTSYDQIFRKLPAQSKLSAKVLKDTLLIIPAGTRQRQKATMALSKLAEFAGLNCDLKRYKGDYGSKSLNPRILPMDKAIAKKISILPNPSWRWVYCMLATYGLRPHEIFFVDFEEDGIIWLREGKTGPRHVSPLYPEWVELFELEADLCPPQNKRKSEQSGSTSKSGSPDYDALGHRVTTQFLRYGVGFPPYHLRHCYARRSKEFGVKPVDAAKLMGHSLDVHFRIYHHWYTKDDVVRVNESIRLNEARPKPPMID